MKLFIYITLFSYLITQTLLASDDRDYLDCTIKRRAKFEKEAKKAKKFFINFVLKLPVKKDIDKEKIIFELDKKWIKTKVTLDLHGKFYWSIEEKPFDPPHPTINKKLKADEKILQELNNKVTAVEDSVKSAQDKVDSFIDSDFDGDIDAKQDLIQGDSDLLSTEEDQLDAVTIKKSKINKLIKELSIELSGAITCPSCAHEFTLDCKHGK